MAGVGARGKTADGSWRPDTPFSSADGLKVTMRRAAGVTPKDVLRVPMRFQTPPVGDFRRPFRFNWSTYDTVAAGQRSRPMGAQLVDLSIDVLMMDRIAADASSGIVVWDDAPHPQRVLNELRYIAGVDDERRGPAAPFRLTISQPAVWGAPVVNIIATLTSIEPVQRPGHLATEFVSLSFLEHEESRASGQQRRRSKPSDTHTLRPGDTLHRIASTYLRRASAWRDIAKANGIRGVSPGDAEELVKWARRHHKTTLTIPGVELVGRTVGDPVLDGDVSRVLGRTSR